MEKSETSNLIKLNVKENMPTRTAFNGYRVLAVLESEATRDHFLTTMRDFAGIELDVTLARDTEETARALAYLLDHSEEKNALFLECSEPEEHAKFLHEIRASEGGQNLYVCSLILPETDGVMLNLIQEGADDIAPPTPTVSELSAALARAASKRPMHKDISGQQEDKFIVFIHAAGGAGATTLAVNTAAVLQDHVAEASQNVCLIDFDLQFGLTDLHLDLQVRSNILDLVQSPHRLDRRMLANLMVETPSGLSVLTPPKTPIPLEALESETIDNILDMAGHMYSHVVIDMPIALVSWTDRVLERADKIYLVTQVNVMALRSARRLLDTFDLEGLSTDNIEIVANRQGRKDRGSISPAQAAKTLGRPISHFIPSDFRHIIESLDHGVPICLRQPKAKYSRSVFELLRPLLQDSADGKTKSAGFFWNRG